MIKAPQLSVQTEHPSFLEVQPRSSIEMELLLTNSTPIPWQSCFMNLSMDYIQYYNYTPDDVTPKEACCDIANGFYNYTDPNRTLCTWAFPKGKNPFSWEEFYWKYSSCAQEVTFSPDGKVVGWGCYGPEINFAFANANPRTILGILIGLSTMFIVSL